MGERRRVRLLISGRVQGVWFRASTREHAVRLGLSGWVRNLGDARVEAVAEGDPEGVAALEVWCRRGPAGAKVDDVEAIDEAPTFEGGGFRIRR